MAIGRHVRVNIIGNYAGVPWDGEIWQTGFSLTTGNFVPGFAPYIKATLPNFQVNLTSYNESDATWTKDFGWTGDGQWDFAFQTLIADKCRTFIDSLKTYLPSASRMVSVGIAPIGTDGKQAAGTSWFTLKTPLAGTAAGTTWRPPQDAVVLSLRTGARGPAGRGRMFLPLNAISLTSGLIGSSVTTNVLNAGQALLEDLSTGSETPVVVNKQALTFSTVTDIAVGDEVDTQRRRRNARPETYTYRDLNL